MSMRPKCYVVVATLNRPSIDALVNSLRAQLYTGWELVVWSGGRNQSEAENQAVEYILKSENGKEDPKNVILNFTDDDTAPPPDWLSKRMKTFEDERIRIADGPLIVAPGRGYPNEMKFTTPGLGIGANLSVRADSFLGFEVFFGQQTPPKSVFRQDTDLLYRTIEQFGEDCYKYDDATNVHPDAFGSTYSRQNDVLFFGRHMRLAERYILPLNVGRDKRAWMLAKAMEPYHNVPKTGTL